MELFLRQTHIHKKTKNCGFIDDKTYRFLHTFSMPLSMWIVVSREGWESNGSCDIQGCSVHDNTKCFWVHTSIWFSSIETLNYQLKMRLSTVCMKFVSNEKWTKQKYKTKQMKTKQNEILLAVVNVNVIDRKKTLQKKWPFKFIPWLMMMIVILCVGWIWYDWIACQTQLQPNKKWWFLDFCIFFPLTYYLPLATHSVSSKLNRLSPTYRLDRWPPIYLPKLLLCNSMIKTNKQTNM